MSLYYGECNNCGDKGSLDAVVVEPNNVEKKLCYFCCLEYWEMLAKNKAFDKYRDPDDERKYGGW